MQSKWLVFSLVILGLLISIFSLFRCKLPLCGVYLSDKYCHFFAYGLLSLFVAIFLQKETMLSQAMVLMLAFGFSFCLGGFLEFCQLFLPGRVFEVADLAANMWGSFVGGLIGMLIVRGIR